MLKPRWRKVIRDLWGNKTRSLLVVLSIAIGVFAVGMILGTNQLLDQDLPEAYARIEPPDVVLFTSLFEEDVLDVVARTPGVEAVEGRRNFTASFEKAPGDWQEIELTFLSDFNHISVSKIFPVEGAWPPDNRTLLAERASLPYLNADLGETLRIETRDGRQRELALSGVAHDINIEPVQFTNVPYVYANRNTLEYLTNERAFDELHIQFEIPGETPLTEEEIRLLATDLENKLEKAGTTVFWTWVPTPGEHPAEEAINPVLLILGVMGGLSLLLSGFLVVNIINGLLAQHVRQIGIMKAIGARSTQVMQMYFTTVVIFGLLSLLIAVPLGGLAAYAFASFLAGLINFDLSGFYIPGQVLLVQTAVGIIVPLVAALAPVITGSLISVRQAISEQGMGRGKFGSHFVDLAMSWITTRVLRLSRPMSISLRNTIRRKMRLAMTLITLTLGGAIFISIISVHASLLATLDDALGYFNYDAEVDFNKAYRIAEIQREAYKVPGVVAVESWVGNSGRRLAADGTEGENLFILGTNAETEIIKPQLIDGRWLHPDDTNAVVLNTAVLQQEEDPISIGDTITLKMDDDESEWVVVGMVRSVMVGPIIYANQPYLAREMNFIGRAGSVQVLGERQDAASQAALAEALQTHFDSVGLEVSSTGTLAETREGIVYQFNIIVVFLVVMAILIAVVGGLGLMGTMSISVLERTREVGIMRAVGASDRSVARIVVVEGMFIGLLSWVVSAFIAFPLGRFFSDMVGNAILESPLTYVFAVHGAVGWVAAIILISTLASLIPARKASRMSVRETLAYE